MSREKNRGSDSNHLPRPNPPRGTNRYEQPRRHRALAARALEFSPDNVFLRRHLAETLLGHGRPDEAAEEYRRMLVDSPKDAGLQLALARAYYQAGKLTQSLVVVEELMKADAPAAGVLALFARLLYQRGEVERAVRQYRAAVSQDVALADDSFAQQLGIDQDEGDDEEVVGGRVRVSAAYDDEEATVDAERPAQ